MPKRAKVQNRIPNGSGLQFRSIESGRVGKLLDRWALAEQGRRLKQGWKVELLTDPYLYKGNLGVVAITRPDGKIIYRGRTAGEYPLENDKRQARVRVEMHRHTRHSVTGPIRLNSQGVLAILEEVALSQRAADLPKPRNYLSFDRLRVEAKRQTFDNPHNLHELVQHLVHLFGGEIKYRRAIRDLVRDEEMHHHLRALNALDVPKDERRLLPDAASRGLSTHLVPVLDYLEKKSKQFKKEK